LPRPIRNNHESEGEAPRRIPPPDPPWQLRLYVNGTTSLRTIITLQNLTELCEKYLAGRYKIEVIDLVENLELAKEDQILALPTLVRRSPSPVRKIIGDLANTDQVITALGLTGMDRDV
jgi:circadian clock protein KaiB